MNTNEHINDVSQDDLPIAAVERLVMYEEAQANGSHAAETSEFDVADNDELACVDLLHRVWPDLAPAAEPNDSPTPKLLGDFRLLRELGRGGMGTVFEAEQISMGRHVALKVLPFAALVHENSLQRFRNEVRAAAALNHPHIVPVYSIGEERGIHFYAMQLVRGQTLADMIDGLRKANRMAAGSEAPTVDSSVTTPTETKRDAQGRISTAADLGSSTEAYRTAARLGIQAAEALQHAHDQGVLHRDIKPSNLMLNREGKLYVTDFGLARIEADAGMTMTGDILGTLRYMAPEQALAKRVVVDHRADIYSLGATLYELLTLQPAFGETDRSELLKQIAFQDPRPLRKLDGHMPAELETIVLKAMAKNPDDRYETAQQLAGDLQAFVEDRPIKAKPPTLLNRAAKWSRRHRAVATVIGVAGLLALVLVVGSSIAALLLAREQDATAQALQVSEQKERALQVNNAELEKERRRAEVNASTARAAVDRMLTRVAGELEEAPHLTELQRELLEDALKFYEQFLQQNQNDLTIRHETARAYIRVGRMQSKLERVSAAEEALKKGIVLLEELAKQFPSDSSYREELSNACRAHSIALLWTDKNEEQIQLATRALATAKANASNNPSDPTFSEHVARAENQLGFAYVQAALPLQAESHRREGLRVLEKLYEKHPDKKRIVETEWSKRALADLRFKEGRYDESLQLTNEVLNTYLKSLDNFPDVPENRRLVGDVNADVGERLWQMGRIEEAEDSLRRGLFHKDKLAQTIPGSIYFRNDAGYWHLRLGKKLAAIGRESDAVAEFRLTQDYYEASIKQFPDARQSNLHLALFLATCPAPQFQDPPRAVKHARRALQFSTEHPLQWEVLGVALYLSNDLAGAEQAFAKSFDLQPKRIDSEDFFYRAIVAKQLNKQADALKWYKSGMEKWPNRPPVAPWLCQLRDKAAAAVGIDKSSAATGQNK